MLTNPYKLIFNWIDANQLGRRNLTPEQQTFIRGRWYNRTKKAVGGDYTSQEALVQNELLLPNTAETI